jgi:hypothetical protein
MAAAISASPQNTAFGYRNSSVSPERLKGLHLANLFDTTNAATTEPEKIVAGDRLIWKRTNLNADYAIKGVNSWRG